MPALVLFGRRSRVGSDDLYCPALLLIMYQLPLLLVCVGYLAFWRGCSTMGFNIEGVPFWFMLGAVPIYGFVACIYLMIVRVSSKGTIVEQERRMLMPRVLQIHIVWSCVMFVYGVMGLVLWYHTDMCYPDSNFVLVRACVALYYAYQEVSGINCIIMYVNVLFIIGDRCVHGRRGELHAHAGLLHIGRHAAVRAGRGRRPLW